MRPLFSAMYRGLPAPPPSSSSMAPSCAWVSCITLGGSPGAYGCRAAPGAAIGAALGRDAAEEAECRRSSRHVTSTSAAVAAFPGASHREDVARCVKIISASAKVGERMEKLPSCRLGLYCTPLIYLISLIAAQLPHAAVVAYNPSIECGSRAMGPSAGSRRKGTCRLAAGASALPPLSPTASPGESLLHPLQNLEKQANGLGVT